MAKSSTVQFVSAGLLAPKKRDHALARRQLYLNYGALTLATLLARDGLDARLTHGDHEDPLAFADALFRDGRLPSAWPLLLSVPSFYALGWTQAFCREVKLRDPTQAIVLGGRWVTGPDPVWLQRLVPEADTVFPGLGEGAVRGLIGLPEGPRTNVADSMPRFGLKHSLVDGFRAFQPSLETSRGCGMGCGFCEERDLPLTRLREPEAVAEILSGIGEEYRGEIHPYFQSSFFLPNRRWAEKLGFAVRSRGLEVAWRCETRVDGMRPDTVASLAAAGMRVVDLGLESACLTQIRAMRKARDADRYLGAASELLRACRANGVWVKVNILLYGGENATTIAETTEWLDRHADYIKGVSVGPVVVFGPRPHAEPFLRDLRDLGATPVDAGSADATGVTAMHLSPELDAAAAERVSVSLSRRYMGADDYWDLKSFSYYPRGFMREAFDRDVAASDADRLPFRTASVRQPPLASLRP